MFCQLILLFFQLKSYSNITTCRESRKDNEEIDISAFTSFLEEVKLDYQNAGQMLRTSLDKFKDRYNAAKSKSIPRLLTFLYDLDQNFEPAARLKSGPAIWVQVESVKRRKTKRSGGGSENCLEPSMKKRKMLTLGSFLPEKRRKRVKRIII